MQVEINPAIAQAVHGSCGLAGIAAVLPCTKYPKNDEYFAEIA